MKTTTDNKLRMVSEGLAGTPLVVALHFKNKTEQGILLASESQRNVTPWVNIEVPRSSAWQDVPGEEAEAPKDPVIGIFAGVGNQTEVLMLADAYRGMLSKEMSFLGTYKTIGDEVLKAFADAINQDFRSQEFEVGYRVEILLVTIFHHILEIHRIKSDGDFHSVVGYGIIGGYENVFSETEEKTTDTSVRSAALDICADAYKRRPPTLEGAARLAKKILELQGRNLPFKFHTTVSF